MKCPRCQQENPPHAKFCLECATPARSIRAEFRDSHHPGFLNDASIWARFAQVRCTSGWH